MASSGLTHVQRVTRLYRRSLKHMLSWTIDRALWREEALELRARFDANKEIKDVRKAAQLLEEGEKEFQLYIHPDPYIRKSTVEAQLEIVGGLVPRLQ